MKSQLVKLLNISVVLLITFLQISCQDENNTIIPDPPEEPGDKPFAQIPDENFEKMLLELGIDSDGSINQQILLEDAEGVTHLHLISADSTDQNGKISDLTGIEAFINLVELRVENSLLNAVSLHKNTALEKLNLNFNQLKSIDLSHNPALTYLSIARNELEVMDLSANENLQYLSLEGNYLKTLDVSNNRHLLELNAIVNELTSVTGLPQATRLKSLNLAWNYLEQLEARLPLLEDLNIDQNRLTHLKVNDCPLLKILIARNNSLAELDLSSNTILQTLLLSANDLKEIDLRQNREMEVFWISNNRLSWLDVSPLSKLYDLSVFGNEELTCINIGENQTIATVRKDDGQFLQFGSCE